jgi:uncharacterized protein involved in exopolysaccharide biosynthesis
LTQATFWQRLMRWVQNRRIRRIVYAVLTIAAIIFCVFPQPYLARAKILPQDNSSTGLNAVLNSIAGQDGVFAAFLSNRQAIDLYLVIARSTEVQNDVVKSLDLVGQGRSYLSAAEAKADIDDKIEINSLTGGLLQIEALSHDRDEAQKLATAYTTAISERIRNLGREQLLIKQQIVRDRLSEANKRVTDAELALEAFRKTAKVSANPEIELGAAISTRASIEAQIQAKRVQIQTLREFAGPENIQLLAAQRDLASLNQQLSALARPTRSSNAPNTAVLTETSNEYLALVRDYKYAQELLEIYARFAEQVAVEDLSSSTSANVQIVETAHIDPKRQYNLHAVAFLLALLLLIFVTEIYAPATGLWSHNSGNRDDQ